jgi:hypothetical protein
MATLGGWPGQEESPRVRPAGGGARHEKQHLQRPSGPPPFMPRRAQVLSRDRSKPTLNCRGEIPRRRCEHVASASLGARGVRNVHAPGNQTTRRVPARWSTPSSSRTCTSAFGRRAAPRVSAPGSSPTARNRTLSTGRAPRDVDVLQAAWSSCRGLAKTLSCLSGPGRPIRCHLGAPEMTHAPPTSRLITGRDRDG